MALNASFAGKVYPPAPAYRVGREKIREFAEAVGGTHPAYVDVEAARALGYPDVIAPPTFAVVVAQRAEAAFITDPDAGIDFSHVVHAEEGFVSMRPIVAGMDLVATVHVVSVTQRAGIAMVTTRTEIAEADGGDDVVHVTSSLVIRED